MERIYRMYCRELYGEIFYVFRRKINSIYAKKKRDKYLDRYKRLRERDREREKRERGRERKEERERERDCTR